VRCVYLSNEVTDSVPHETSAISWLLDDYAALLMLQRACYNNNNIHKGLNCGTRRTAGARSHATTSLTCFVNEKRPLLTYTVSLQRGRATTSSAQQR